MFGSNRSASASRSTIGVAAEQSLDPDFKPCSALLLDMPMDVRGPTAHALDAMGFGRIDVTRRADKLENTIAKGNYDLMIGDTGSGHDRACDIVRGVRHNTVGRDPFLGVILTTTPVSERRIRRAIDSGADHLLVKPFSASHVGRRIRAIVDSRKPFVVTLDYVGPDRRDEGARAAAAPRIEVPNGLRAKARGDATCLATPAAIGSAMFRINQHKIARYDHEVGVLIALITLSFGLGEPAKARAAKLKKLIFLISDLISRVADTALEAAAPHCVGLIKIIHGLSRETGTPASERLEELAETAMALHLAVNPGATARQISGRIDAAVARILDQRAIADA